MRINLDHKTLQLLFSRFHISLPANKLVLFAFRGFSVQVPYTGWKKNWQLKTARVDYRHMRCSVGIWDPQTEKIFLAPGSTVPYADYVERAALRGGAGANQLEPGFYTDFKKGEHLEGKADGHEALRQTAPRFVRRTVSGTPYRRKDRLYFSNPYDNLHCAWNPDLNRKGYRSAGCLVVAGMPRCKRHAKPMQNQGHWKVFHQIIYGAGQRKFRLLLLESAQVKAALQSTGEKSLLCYGSSGEAVKSLQKGLKKRGIYKGPVTGILDARTYKAWNSIGLKNINLSHS
jgi:hypothetical protein